MPEPVCGDGDRLLQHIGQAGEAQGDEARSREDCHVDPAAQRDGHVAAAEVPDPADGDRIEGSVVLDGDRQADRLEDSPQVTGGLAPNQRPMIAKLGLKALLAGSLSNLMSAALAGLMLGIAPPLAAPPAPNNGGT